MNKFLHLFMFVVFYIIYFKLFRFLWLKFIPSNTITDIVSLFVVIIFLMPLALISTVKFFEVIQEK